MTAAAEFERLYIAHAGAVRGYVMRRCDAAVADDVVSDVFLVAWRRLSDVPEDPLPWLLGTARRVLANYARGRDRRLALSARLAAEPQVGPAPLDADGQRVMSALASLREKDRELLLLLAWEGLELRQAAKVLGVRANTLAVRLHRARRRLAAALEAGDEPGTKPLAAVEVSP